MTIEKGLLPIYTPNSRILILGTLPSQTSRASNSYYANNGNKFWKVICEYLGVPVPDNYEQRIQILNKNDIAVWDLIDTCEIEGSKDSTINNPVFNNLQDLLNKTNIELIILNGKTAFEMYEKNFKELPIYYKLVPSTSPINATFDKYQWFDTLAITEDKYERAVQYYIKLKRSSTLYKTVQTNAGKTYTFDENYGIGRTCVELGVRRDLLKEALIKNIKQGKL